MDDSYVAGIVGLLWVSLFHYQRFRDVSISEVAEHRKEMAARLNLGFEALHPKDLAERYDAAMKAGDETWGFDVIVDCTGTYN